MPDVTDWREEIGRRTRAGIERRRAAGLPIGRPRVLSDEVLSRVVAERGQGRPLAAIAAALDADGILAAMGGTWNRGKVAKALRTAQRAGIGRGKAA